MRCPKCGGYRFDGNDRCLGCGHSMAPNKQGPAWWGQPSLQKPKSKQSTPSEPIKLSRCPECGEISVFYNEVLKRHECVRSQCPSNRDSLFANVVWPDETFKLLTDPDIPEGEKQQILENPMLLGVKMFLADIRSWRRQYRDGEYVCSDFTQEVYDAATERGMRCGYVIVSFSKSDIGHAIIAFETDYGLKYFEPQSGNEEDVIIGRHYSAKAQGVDDKNVISAVEIRWNDGTTTRLD